MRLSLKLFTLCLLAILFTAGCDRVEPGSVTAEVDEIGYRRGKDLLRQGRNQEALAEFQKVVEKRGLNQSPETHLELGLLYHQHIRDPIAAIYHFRKFRELKPNAQQADLVRQRIDAALRDFARTLPGQPLDSPTGPADYSDIIQRLQRENEQLRSALGAARVAAGFSARPPVDERGNISGLAPEHQAALDDSGPVSPAQEVPAGEWTVAEVPAGDEPIADPRPDFATATAQDNAVRLPRPLRPSPAPTPQPTAQVATTGPRRHIVKSKESLYSIARQYYGVATAARVDQIYNANRDKLRSPTDVKVGMELKIP